MPEEIGEEANLAGQVKTAVGQPEVNKLVRRDELFARWLQKRMMVAVSGRDGREGERSQKTLARITSDAFWEKLLKWEPWRLEELSVRRGKNLYVAIAKAYASEGFLETVHTQAHSLGISDDEYIAGVIETARKIAWESLKVMVEKGCAKTSVLPLFVLAEYPNSDLRKVEVALEHARKEKKVEGLFSREAALQYFDLGARIALAEEEVRHLRVLVYGGRGTVGSSIKNLVALDTRHVKMDFIKRFNPGDFVRTVVEEEVHHQDYRQVELEALVKTLPEGTVGEKIRIKQGFEEKIGIKAFVEEVMQELVPMDVLFEPFNRRLQLKRETGKIEVHT